MINHESESILKYENIHLKEDLVHYKNVNIDLRARVRDLEDENRALKNKLEKLITVKGKTKKKYELGSHFPQKLLRQTRNSISKSN